MLPFLLDYHQYWSLRSLPSQQRPGDDTDVEMAFRPTRSPIPEDDESSPLTNLSSSDQQPAPIANAPPLASLSSHAESFHDEVLAENRHRLEPSTPERRGQRQYTSAPAQVPTPYRPALGLSNHSGTSPARPALEKYLQALLVDKSITEYPVVDFIEAVFGMRSQFIQPGRNPFFLDEDATHKYLTMKYERKAKRAGERTSYPHLLTILTSLSRQLQGRVSRNQQPLIANDCHMVKMDDVKVLSKFCDLKPDFLFSWHSEKKNQMWDFVGVSGELGKTNFETQAEAREVKLTIEMRKIPSRTYNPPTAATGEKRKASGSTEDNTARKRLRSDGPEDNCGTHPTMRKKTSFSPKQLQAISYVHELGSHGIRSYASGFLIEDRIMSLWYIDRTGLVKSEDFDFLLFPHLLVLYVAAIKYATPRQLGFFDLLEFPAKITPSTFKTLAGVSLKLPTALDVNEQTLRDVHFVVTVSGRRKVISTHGAIGRCTSVLPIKAAADSQAAQQLCHDEVLVAKVSWQSVWRTGEDTHIRVARVALGEKESTRRYLKHVVDMKCSLTRTMKEMGLPRAAMYGLPEDEEAARFCRVLVLKAYLPLTEVKNPDEFMTAFVGALRGHRAVYECAQILHRDVSVNNIMFHRVDNDKVVGVMCDWDLAKKLEASDTAIDIIIEDTVKSMIPPDTTSNSTPSTVLADKQPTAQHRTAAVDGQHPVGQRNVRTGTGPFMALDLLTYEQVPHHLYRYDLESFFYVLVWFIAMYDPEKRTLGHIEEWLKGTFKDIGKNKTEAVRDILAVEAIMEGGHADYAIFIDRTQNILTRLVTPTLDAYTGLRRAMTTNLSKVPRSERGSLSQEQKITLLEADIRSDVIAREEIMSYEAFMDCLGIPAEEN